MFTQTFSSRRFNQDVGIAKKAASLGPVIITDRGRPAHVLLTFDDYLKLQKPSKSIAELFHMPGAEDSDFELPDRREHPRTADFS